MLPALIQLIAATTICVEFSPIAHDPPVKECNQLDAQSGGGRAPDYSMVESREAAEKLVDDGELIPMQLVSALFGGDSADHNIVYVPPVIAEWKERIENDMVAPLVEQKIVKQLRIEPDYFENSIIPTKIVIRAFDPGEFTHTYLIWEPADEAKVR